MAAPYTQTVSTMIKTPKHFSISIPQQLQKRRLIPRNQETETTAQAQETRSPTSAGGGEAGDNVGQRQTAQSGTKVKWRHNR
jgi:hypothetical protein